MRPKVINATIVRTRTREILERAKYGRECFLVETFGQPTAIIMNVDAYKEIKRTRRIKCANLSKARRRKRIPKHTS